MNKPIADFAEKLKKFNNGVEAVTPQISISDVEKSISDINKLDISTALKNEMKDAMVQSQYIKPSKFLNQSERFRLALFDDIDILSRTSIKNSKESGSKREILESYHSALRVAIFLNEKKSLLSPNTKDKLEEEIQYMSDTDVYVSVFQCYTKSVDAKLSNHIFNLSRILKSSAIIYGIISAVLNDKKLYEAYFIIDTDLVDV